MMKYNVVRFRIGGSNSGAYFYEKMIEEALVDHGVRLVSFSTFKPEKKFWHLFRFVTYTAYWLNAHVKLWLTDMVAAMKPGSVVIDLAAERGGNCDLTVANKRITSDNGVTIVGYTDFPSRMAAQASSLYATNIRHMLTDLTPEKNGTLVVNMEDDVIRGVTIAHGGSVTFPPPPPKIPAIAAKPKDAVSEKTPEERRAEEAAAFQKQTKNQVTLLACGTALLLLVGTFAPASFMQHFIVFVLSVFVGFQVIWNVSHSLHTPLMAVTNAISSIIILGATLQIGSANNLVIILAGISVFFAGINIFGGFLVTRRMLAMFQKS